MEEQLPLTDCEPRAGSGLSCCNRTAGPRPGVLMTPQMCSPRSGRKRWKIKGSAPSEALGKGPSCVFQLLGAPGVPWLVATQL